jgi:hypothetical protein
MEKYRDYEKHTKLNIKDNSSEQDTKVQTTTVFCGSSMVAHLTVIQLSRVQIQPFSSPWTNLSVLTWVVTYTSMALCGKCRVHVQKLNYIYIYIEEGG